MKHVPSALTRLTIVLVISAACFQPSAFSAEKKLRIGIYQNIPLTFTDEEGNAKGFFIDIMNYIADKEGWEVEYLPASWPECLENLIQNRIDLLGVIAFSNERGKYFDYTYESVSTEWGQLYVGRGSEIESLLDLNGKKVAVLMDDIHFKEFRALLSKFEINCRFIEAFEYEDVLTLIEIGKCDAGLVSQLYGLQYEDNYGIQKSAIVLSPQKLYWASAKGKNDDILDQVDFHLRHLKANENSIYYRSIRKWLSGEKASFIDRWLNWIIIGFSGILAMAGVIIFIFRSQVKLRTEELYLKNEKLISEIEHRQKAESERVALEAKLQRARKMEALGTLAGGVAHDLNNILSGIVSYPELLLVELPKGHRLRAPLQTIKRSGEKAAQIVQDLLTLARRGVSAVEVVNLNHIIKAYLSSPEFNILRISHPQIDLDLRLNENLFNISGSPVHLSKTIMNMVMNAVEAMPNGGNITIATENRYIDAPVKGYDEIDKGDYVVVTIRDEGIGISDKDIDRIFEPFYTKKVMGRSGTGLGMAVVWGTVKDHRGYIDIQSQKDRGTVFSLYFPASRQACQQHPRDVALEEIMGKKERVLIVDDLKEQREIASLMLNKLGYVAASVSSGEAAIEYLKEHEADILLLDMIMSPGMGGLETYRQIISIARASVPSSPAAFPKRTMLKRLRPWAPENMSRNRIR